jgi:long-chain fatty acid transport protein
MSTLSSRTILGVAAVLALAAGTASATNGYYTHGTGTKSKAQAGAGSANPEEILSLATNPAGIAYLPETIDASLGIFSPRRDYKTSDSLANGGCSPQGCAYTIGPNNLTSKNEYFYIPNVAMNWKLSDVDYLAAAFYARGGMNTQWNGGTATYDPTFGNPEGPGPQTFPGTYGGGTAGVDLMQGFLNLTYARKLGDTFSAGASAIFAMQRFQARGVSRFAPFTKTFVSTFDPLTGTGDMPQNLSGNGHQMSYGYGASIGLQWHPTDNFGFAAAYTSKMSMSKLTDYKDLFAQGGGFDMPATWTAGISFKPTSAWALMFDVQGIDYSGIPSVGNGIQNLFKCPTLSQDFSNFNHDVQYCLGGSRGAGFGWKDMTVYKFGASWKYNDTWTWRGGYSFTHQPIPTSQMTMNILAPGVMEEHWTMGFSRQQSSGNELNLSFMYAPTHSVKGPQNFDPTQTVEFSMDEFELEVSYSWKR